MTEIEIRNDVDVLLMNHMGDDEMLCKAARVSTLGEASLESTESTGLLRFLMNNRHGTPFEHAAMTFLIRAPIFVFREFHRHRVGWSYNEESGRYRQLRPIFYVPAPDRALVQEGKPGEYRYVPGTESQQSMVRLALVDSYAKAYRVYEQMLEGGIAREVARACLPVATFSSMYATCNPRSLMHFLSLRTKRDHEYTHPPGRPFSSAWVPEPDVTIFPPATFPSFPQREIEMVAEKMEEHFARLFPTTWRLFCENGRVAP